MDKEEGIRLKKDRTPQSHRGLALVLPLILALSFFVSIASLLYTSDVVRAQNGVDFIRITDSPGGNPIRNKAYRLMENDTYYCSGYNFTDGYIGLVLCDWYSENRWIVDLNPTNNTNWTGVSAIEPGTTRVRAFYIGGDPTGDLVNSTGELTVLAGEVDNITIMHYSSDGTGTLEWVGDEIYHVGEQDWFYAVAFNDTLGQLGMVPVNWTTNNPNVCSITTPGDRTSFGALSEGTCKVTAEFEKELYNSTGTLTVLPKVDYVAITDAPGGNPIGNMTYNLGEEDTYYCSGYNLSLGYIGLVGCYWQSQNWTVGDVEPRQGEIVTFRAKAFGFTIVSVYIYDHGQNYTWNTTGILEVVPDNVNYIVIEDESSGGKAVGNVTYVIGDKDTFYAVAYNFTQGALGLLSVNWTTTNSTACGVTSFGASTSFKAVREGVCQVKADYKGIYANSTGTLNVTKGGMITVDDDLPADYKTIQEAIDAASPGGTIYVYAGTYPEHVIVNKTVTLRGEDEEKVIVTGSGSGKVFNITADAVSIHRFTIRDGKYGVYSDMIDGLVLEYSIITNYTYGLYHWKTTDSWVTYNDISVGAYGIVAYYAYDDAFRHNYISYNTAYGAKGFDVQLKNCFNWNHFYKNKIAYWYDPDQPLDTLEFDGNILEDNEIGIKVSGSSTINLTNNTLLNNDIGIYILEASPLVMGNTLTGNRIGIYCEDSSSLILQNTILDSEYGVYCENASPYVENNNIGNSDELGIYVVGAASGTILGNDLNGGKVRLEDSQIGDISLTDSEFESVSSNFGDVELDSDSRVTIIWRVRVQVLDEDSQPIKQARVWVYDNLGDEVKSIVTRSDGWTKEFEIIQKKDTIEASQSFNPHTITATKDELTGSLEDTIEQDRQLTIILRPPTQEQEMWIPLELLVVLGSALVLSAGIGAFFASEGFKIAVISLFVPLYMKLRKSKILDNYDRGRVYQYIEINPGEHYSQIKRDLDLPNGSLVHHLGVLEKAGEIKSRKDGRYRRFYTRGTRIPENNGGVLTEVQRRISDTVKDLPGVTQKELASLLGVHQSSINYQMRKLEERGLVRTERKGRKVHYYYVGKE